MLRYMIKDEWQTTGLIDADIGAMYHLERDKLSLDFFKDIATIEINEKQEAESA